MDIKLIKNSIKADNYEMSLHALERAIERDIWKEDIHVVCAFSPIIRIITLYRPDEEKWIDYKRRK